MSVISAVRTGGGQIRLTVRNTSILLEEGEAARALRVLGDLTPRTSIEDGTTTADKLYLGPIVNWSFNDHQLGSPEGAVVYVTGDTANERHGVPAGTQVTVQDWRPETYLRMRGTYLVRLPNDKLAEVSAVDLDVEAPGFNKGDTVELVNDHNLRSKVGARGVVLHVSPWRVSGRWDNGRRFRLYPRRLRLVHRPGGAS